MWQRQRRYCSYFVVLFPCLLVSLLYSVSVKHFTERRRGFPRKSMQIPGPGSQNCVKDYFIVKIDSLIKCTKQDLFFNTYRTLKAIFKPPFFRLYNKERQFDSVQKEISLQNYFKLNSVC